MSRSVWFPASVVFAAFAIPARAELVAHWAMDTMSEDGSVASQVGGKMLAGNLVGDARRRQGGESRLRARGRGYR